MSLIRKYIAGKRTAGLIRIPELNPDLLNDLSAIKSLLVEYHQCLIDLAGEVEKNWVADRGVFVFLNTHFANLEYATWSKVQYDNIKNDSSHYVTADSQFIAPMEGLYDIGMFLRLHDNPAVHVPNTWYYQRWQAAIYVNGDKYCLIAEQMEPSAGGVALTGSCPAIYLKPGDKVDTRVYHETYDDVSATQDIQYNSIADCYGWFAIHWAGENARTDPAVNMLFT